MSDHTPASYTIVPWVRRGLASLITSQPATNFASLPVTLKVNDTQVNAPAVRLIGPGQITALDPRAVVRTEPRDGATGFEPNHMPMVELAQPDLPWMFTSSPTVNGRLQPWICLVVVPDAAGIELDPSTDGISVLRINSPFHPQTELPDLSTIDAWVHAQVTSTDPLLTDDALKSALDGDPAATVSRLVAPRHLEANTAYIACIVPTYRVGAQAALGQPVDDHDLAPAWDVNTPPDGFALPVYYSFRFHTGADGDFASLARDIRPPQVKLDAGTRTIDISQPGFGTTGVAGVTLGLEGALRTLDNQPTAWPDGAQAVYESQLRAALAPPSAGDPVVAPPTYGSAHSGSDLPAHGGTPVWLGELNLDPRTRAAAAAGAQVVQHDQEALVASAWDQWGEISKANQLLRQAQLAREVSISMSTRHLQRVAGDGVWLQITTPVHSRVRVSLAGVTATLYGHIQSSRLPSGSLSAALRRISRPGGPVGRQMSAGRSQLVDRLNLPAGTSAAIEVAGPLLPPRGMVAFDDVEPTVQIKDMTATSVLAAGGWRLATETSSTGGDLAASSTAAPAEPAAPAAPAETAVHAGPVEGAASTGGPTVTSAQRPLVEWQSNPNLPDILRGGANSPPPIAFPTDTAALKVVQTNFQRAAASVNTYINTAPVMPPDPQPLGGQPRLAPARAQLLARLNPADTIRVRVGARIPLGAGPDPLQPIQTGPTYPQPMYAPLAQLSPEWMLPGISEVPADSVTLLKPNPAFIEAYMVGLNDELARELLWREFPADRTVTFFKNFWASSRQDIEAISAFTANDDLGKHVTGSTGTMYVLLIRATLFQRYPSAMVYAAPAKWSGSVRVLGDDVQYPVFRGQIGADVTFFGFNINDDLKGSDDPAANKPGWYFVISEHITEPRLGLEPLKSKTPTGSWNDLSWQEVSVTPGNYVDVSFAPPTPSGETIGWSRNSAALAYILMRRPVRVAMHARSLLGGNS